MQASFEQFIAYLAYLGCMTLAMCGVMIADYYLVRRGRFDHASHKIENWNWAGVITLITTAAVGIVLIATDIFSLGFLISFVAALALYPVLRRALPEGTGTGFVAEEQAMVEAL